MRSNLSRALLLALLLATGCASRAAYFRLTHPAMLDATPHGSSFTVTPMDGGYPAASSQIRQEIEQRIVLSLNRSLRLVSDGAGLRITGAVLSNDYQERFDRHDQECSRRVEAGRDATGRMQYRTERYRCTWVTRVGSATVRVELRIVAAANGQVLYTRIFENRQEDSSSGLHSPYPAENRDPAPIDGAALLRALNSRIVEEFARVILPWQEVVEVNLEDCDDDPRCERAFQLIRAGDLTGAEALLTEVIDETAAAAAAPNADDDLVERLAEALYNRGVARGYQGRYAEGVADLARATALRPDESGWPAQLAAVRGLQQNQETLRRQGAIAAERQDIRAGGSP